MKKNKLMLILGILTVLMSGLTLTRCGSGLGANVSANVNSSKF